jgi:hypothetical protein
MEVLRRCDLKSSTPGANSRKPSLVGASNRINLLVRMDKDKGPAVPDLYLYPFSNFALEASVIGAEALQASLHNP